MKRLQTYVLAETCKALIPAFFALVLIMVVGFCMQLLHEGLDVVRLHRLLPPLLGYCVPIVLPSAFLTAAIMAFGRLSADNELVAVRAAGVHTFRIIYPVLVFAVLLGGLATAFQFELVPRCRAAIETFKYEALKQILLDKAALSARRQFKFGPAFIMYDDFSKGRLRDLLVLEIPDRQPRRIATAQSCVIRTEPDKPGEVFFQMEDASLYHFGPSDYAKGEPGTSERMTLRVSVAPGKSDIMTDEKHLPTLKLLARLNQLEKQVAQQEQFDRPNAIIDETRKELWVLEAEIKNLNAHIEQNQEDYREHAVAEVQSSVETIKHHEERIETLRREQESLEERRRELVERLSQMGTGESGGMDHTDYDRWAEYDKELQERRAQIESHEKEIQKLQAGIEQARQSMKESTARAERINTQTAELKAHRDKLAARRGELLARKARADAQDDLISVRLRIHKRLAQSVSLVIFALLGIPLGIIAGGRSVMVAFGISFAIVLVVFYPFLIVGQIAAKAAVLPVVPAMWAGNVFVGIIGLAAMLKVLRD